VWCRIHDKSLPLSLFNSDWLLVIEWLSQTQNYSHKKAAKNKANQRNMARGTCMRYDEIIAGSTPYHNVSKLREPTTIIVFTNTF